MIPCWRWLSIGLVAGALGSALPAAGEEPPGQDVVPEFAELTGKDIFERVQANRFKALFQKERLVSKHPKHSDRTVEFWVRWKDNRDEDGRAKDGVWFKALIKYTSPGDLRDVAYLIQWNEHPPHDLFGYSPQLGRVHRLNLDETITGTDYTVAEILPRYADASDYVRLPDEEVAEMPCYVLELVPKGGESEYSKIRVFVEQEHYVPVRALYWNRNERLAKQWDARVDTLEELRDVWFVREATMQDLIEGSSTTRYIDEIDPDAPIKDSIFSVRQLGRRSR